MYVELWRTGGWVNLYGVTPLTPMGIYVFMMAIYGSMSDKKIYHDTLQTHCTAKIPG